jgi:hypothetical protein
MAVRVTEPGRPAFQLRKGEEGLSVFDPAAVQPPLTESEILDAFRLGSTQNNMNVKHPPSLEIGSELIDAIRNFPVRREVEHCGSSIAADPFEFYVECTHCGARIKVRSFAATPELEDVFDAVFEWMNQEAARGVAERRQLAIASEE